MSGVSSVFNIAKGALQAQLLSLQVASHNLANVNTPGYTRQIALLETQPSASTGRLNLGLGVNVASITQAVDIYTSQTIHRNIADLSESDTKASTLNYIESLFNDTSGTGLAQALSEFWKAWHDLANNPSGIGERTSLLGKAENLCSFFHSLRNNLSQIIDQANASITIALQEVNVITSQIAKLNGKILEAESAGAVANDLRDQRNILLEKLSNYVGNVYLEDENGGLKIWGGQGLRLVDGLEYWGLESDDGQIFWNDIPVDISKRLTGGKIGGWLDIRDEIVPQYIANLDELAGTLIAQVNARHFNGYTLEGETGKYFFKNFQTAPELPNPSDYTNAAAYIQLSTDVLGNPRNIAAGGSTGDPGDNENALEILNIQNDDTNSITKWVYSERGDARASITLNDTLEHYYHNLIGEIGLLTEQMQQKQEFMQTFLDQLRTVRDSVSGVNVDEELVEVMKIQRAFEAASKLISVADQMLQSLLEIR